MPDTYMLKRPETERLMVVEALVATALADGEVASIEQRRIEQMVRTLRLDVRSRQRVLASIRDRVAAPMPTPDDLPDYDVRLHLFEQAAVLALTDGYVHPEEQRYLRALAMSLELDVEDAKVALRRANEVQRG